MARAADVKSLDALKEGKIALVEFRELVTSALSEAYSDVYRTVNWIQNDRRMFWQSELRRREEKVNMAKSELFREQLSASDGTASCLEQKALLKKAEFACEEARRKIEFVKKWARMLDREMMLFKGKCQTLARAAEGDIPRGEARLEILMDRLEKYVRLAAPAGDTKKGSSRRSGAETAEETK